MNFYSFSWSKIQKNCQPGFPRLSLQGCKDRLLCMASKSDFKNDIILYNLIIIRRKLWRSTVWAMSCISEGFKLWKTCFNSKMDGQLLYTRVRSSLVLNWSLSKVLFIHIRKTLTIFWAQIDCPISFSSYSPKTSHFHHQRPLIFISFYRFITFSIYLLHFSYDDDSCIYFSGAFKNLNASKSCILYGPYLYKYKSLYYITALKAFLISSLPS